MLNRSAMNTAIQILNVWRYISSHPDCVDLPILRALVAEHRDILDIMSTTRAPEFLKLSITIEALSTEKLTYRPELAAVRGRTLYAVTCIEETWAEAISDPGNVNLRKLRAAMAGYDNLLCDLETRQRRIMEDATIHVRVKRKRSPSPRASHKRRCDRQQPAPADFKPTTHPLRKQDCQDEVFRGLMAMARPQMERINRATQPTAGELYLVYNNQSRCWLVALVLPRTNLSDVGISGTLESLGLLSKIPMGFEFNVKTRHLEWRNGWGRNAPHMQIFPIACFASSRFPDSGATGWVRADQLRAFDISRAKPSLVPHYALVQTFLEKRMMARTHRGWIESASPSHEQANGHVNHIDRRSIGRNASTGPEPNGTNSPHELVATQSDDLRPASTGVGDAKSYQIAGTTTVEAPTPKPITSRPSSSSFDTEQTSLPCSTDPFYHCRLPCIVIQRRNIRPPSLPSLRKMFPRVPGVWFGLFEWPQSKEPSKRLLILLARISGVGGLKPLPRDFIDCEGLLRCPLCLDIRQFEDLDHFTEHVLEWH